MIACESFELIDVGDEASLLHVHARTGGSAGRVGIVALVIRNAGREQWLRPLPLPAPDELTLSAVFALAPGPIGHDALYSLTLDDGSTLDLPPPRASRDRDADLEEIAELRHRLASAEAQLEETRSLAATMAAEVEEAQTRADTLAEVVRAETARREALQTRMIEDIGAAQAARADAEDAVARLEQELRELRADH